LSVFQISIWVCYLMSIPTFGWRLLSI
jgi:hypothetical protein